MLLYFSFSMLTGCESLQDTSFAPLDAKLEPIPGGGAQYFVVVNASRQTLHNFRFSVDMWDDHAITFIGNDPTTIPIHLPAMTYRFTSSGSELKPGEVVHFRKDQGMGAEGPVLNPASRVQIAGSCDEGRFREDWQVNGSGQLQPIGTGPHGE